MSTPARNEREMAELSAPPSVRWQRWPLRDSFPRSLIVVAVLVAIAIGVAYVSNSWVMAVCMLTALVVTLETFMLPVTYEAHAGGFRRQTFGRWGGRRVISWHNVRSYQPRATGIILFDRQNPTLIDALRAHFLPYGEDPDETLCAVRQYLDHAEELPFGK